MTLFTLDAESPPPGSPQSEVSQVVETQPLSLYSFILIEDSNAAALTLPSLYCARHDGRNQIKSLFFGLTIEVFARLFNVAVQDDMNNIDTQETQ